MANRGQHYIKAAISNIPDGGKWVRALVVVGVLSDERSDEMMLELHSTVDVPLRKSFLFAVRSEENLCLIFV